MRWCCSARSRALAGFGVIRAEEIAARVGTIAYEVLTALSRRVPRRHVRHTP
jgi:alanine racemase